MLNQENLPKEKPSKNLLRRTTKAHKNMRKLVKIAGVVIEGWIDTGNQITAIGDDLYHLIVSPPYKKKPYN